MSKTLKLAAGLIIAGLLSVSIILVQAEDGKTQALSLQEQYCFENGENEVVLTPLKPDTDSKNMIYHGMQVEINDVKYEYAWDWNASVWQYIVYAPPEE